MNETWLEQLAERGYRARVVALDHLPELHAAIEDGHNQGLVDADLYQRYLSGFVYTAPAELPGACSAVVVAYPDPPVRFTFEWRGARVELLVPPTYLHGLAKDARVQAALTELLSPPGYRVVRARLPVKLLAVRSGLAEYGKNNITYVAGLGSYHRLAAYYSDLRCECDTWQAPWLMAACKLCRACVKACPVAAIPRERVLLRAERCITFWNEKDWQVGFPDWMDAGGHNALVGCMHCQRVCPENWPVAGWIEDGCAFSEAETAILRDGTPADALPPDLVAKLRQWDLLDLLDVLPRNLRTLLDRRAAPAG